MFMLISNNEDLCNHVKSSKFIEGSALDVLIHVRGFVHLGSILLTHPLCGNLRPYQQPFRSVIRDSKNGLVDLESLSLIEDAVHVYESCKLINVNELDELKRVDYAYIDYELMRESLERYRLINRESSLAPAPLLLQNLKEGL